MPKRKPAKFLSAQRKVAIGSGVFALLMSCLVLAGWVMDIPRLKHLVASWPAMKPNTAIFGVLAGSALLLLQRSKADILPQNEHLRGYAAVLSTALVVLAGLTWFEHLLAWDAGIDQLLFRFIEVQDGANNGRMSQVTALSFLAMGIAFLLLSGGERMAAAAQWFAMTVVVLMVLVLLAYVYRADLASVRPFSTIALHTALMLFALGIGVLALGGEHGWVQVFLQDTNSSKLGRRALLGTLVALPILAELRVIAQRDLDLFGTYFGIAILTSSGIWVLTTMNWMATHSGNIADKKIENLVRINSTLSGINQLIVRTQSKAELYQQACSIACTAGRFPWVWLATREPGESKLCVRGANGGTVALMTMLEGRMADINAGESVESIVQRTMRTQLPQIVNDVDVDFARSGTSSTKVQSDLIAQGVHSFVTLPLVVAGESVGVFTLTAEREGFFSDAEMVLLMELVGDIAFAMLHLQQKSALNYLANYDTLTGLPNRVLFEERLGRELRAAAALGERLVLVVGDLKRFRNINETLGRAAGDEVLRQYSGRLQKVMRFPDNLARLGADIFASFVPAYSDLDWNRIKKALEEADHGAYSLPGASPTLHTTVGAAVFPDDGTDCETLIRNAETALKRAKGSGDSFRFYEPRMNARVAESLALEMKLEQALELGQFVLHYQPKVDFLRREVHSVEALIRWNDPETGLVPPGMFIPLMEEIGLIGQVGDWALRQAVADIGRWRAMGLKAPRCAVNVSALQMREDDFAEKILAVTREFGCAESLLDIELTESLVMENVAQTTIGLQRLRNSGIQISVDDFGTGYSSLAYLARLPIHTLKIDRAFIMDLENNEQAQAIVHAIISLAHSLQFSVVAEGVETEGQADILRTLECDLMQGFLFSKAVPFDVLASMLPKATQLMPA